MYPQQPAQQAARRHSKKPPNKALLLTLVSVLGVLALCLVSVVIYGVTSDKKEAEAGTAAAAANGIPPAPDAATTAAYIAALKAIDPDIVGDKDDKTIVNRGRDQCGSVAQTPNDQAKLVELTNKRFTAPGHPNGFGTDKATQILAVVRQHICPTY